MVNIHKLASVTESNTFYLLHADTYLGVLWAFWSLFPCRLLYINYKGSPWWWINHSLPPNWALTSCGFTRMEARFLSNPWYKQAFWSKLCRLLKPLPDSDPTSLVLQMCCFLHNFQLKKKKQTNLKVANRGNCSVMHHGRWLILCDDSIHTGRSFSAQELSYEWICHLKNVTFYDSCSILRYILTTSTWVLCNQWRKGPMWWNLTTYYFKCLQFI